MTSPQVEREIGGRIKEARGWRVDLENADLVVHVELLSDPSLINVEPYGRGWLFEITGAGSELLTPEEYLIHLESAWKLAERTIKGQFNE